MFWVMKLNPQQAPLYGDCIITVSLTDEDQVGSDDAVFYLVFTGSAIQHCASTRKLSSGMLETIAPGHSCCETVKVSLCATKEGQPILVVAEDRLQFVQDEAHDAAQFLASCVGNQQALNFTRFLDRSRPPAGDVDFLDEKVTLAFRHLKLPAEWNVLGAEHTLNEGIPRETLMHFAARLGLLRLAWFLLQQPGGRGAVCVPNSEGATPVSLALERGYQKLHQLLTEEGASEPDCWSTVSHTVHSGECCVTHHRGLDIYILTTETREGVGPSMESDIILLETHMQNHQHMNASKHPLPEQNCKESSPDAEAQGPAAALDCDLGKARTQSSQGDLSVLPCLDAAPTPAPAPACPEDSDCQQHKQLSDMPQALQGLRDAECPKTSGESRNIADRLRKEEKEELPPAVDSGALLVENRSRLHPVANLCRAAGPHSSGTPAVQAGMTSSEAALEQGDPKDSRHFPEEAQAAGTSTGESAPEPVTSCEQDRDVIMGQSECRSCTGSGEVAATARQSLGNGEGDNKPLGTAAAHALPSLAAAGKDPDVSLLGEAPEHAVDLQAVRPIEANTDVGPTEREGSLQMCLETPDNGAGSDFAQRPEDCVLPPAGVQGMAQRPEPELVVVNEEGGLEILPKHDTAAEVCDNPGQPPEDGNTDAGIDALDLSSRVQNADFDAIEKDDRPSQSSLEGEVSCARDGLPKVAEEGQGEQKPLECLPLGTETISCTCRGSTSLGSLNQWAHAVSPANKDPAGKGEQGSCSELCTDSVDASRLPPCTGSPAVLSPVGSEPLCKHAGLSGSTGELDRFSKSAQEFIAVASALLVEEAIQQARQIMAHEDGAGAAPVGQEASAHLEELALPLCGKGTECIPDHRVMGTPSPIHHQESKQNQEAALGAATGEVAAAELTGLAKEGSPVCPELIAEVSHRDTDEEKRPSLQLPGEEEEGLALRAVVQGPCCDGRANESNAEVGLKGKASSPEAGENVRVGTDGDVLQGSSRLLEDASFCLGEAPCADATLKLAPELSLALQEVSHPSGDSAFMEPPLVAHELPQVADLPQEVENVPSRILLQPIAEEPPCDADSGSEVLSLAREGETQPKVGAAPPDAQALSDEGQGEGSRAEPELQLLPPCPTVEWLRKVEVEGPAHEAGGLVVANAENAAKAPEQAASVTEACPPVAPLAGNPGGGPPLQESGAKTLPVLGAGPTLNGEAASNLQPGRLVKPTAKVQEANALPVAGILEMKTEEEVGFLMDPGETATPEGMINRENWCPIEPLPDPSLLKPKHPCHTAGTDTFLEDGLSADGTSSRGILKGGSGSDCDLFPLPADGLDEVDFEKQPEEEQSVGESTSSSSSADDTVSLERNSSLGSDISLPRVLGLSRPKDQFSPDGSCFSVAAGAEGQDGEASLPGELDEELDSITEVPPPSSALRSTIRPPSPFRRHSWGPGKNSSSEAEINHRSLSWCPSGVQCTAMGADFNGRSYSLEGLAGEPDVTKKPPPGLESSSLTTKDLRQSPPASDDRGSLVSLTEEELESEQEVQGFDRQIRQRAQPRFTYSTNPVSPPLTKSLSLMTIAQAGPDTQGRTRPSRRISFSFSISPLIPKSKTVFSIGCSSSDEEEELASNRSFSSTSSSLSQSICEESGNLLPPSPSRKDLEGKSVTKVSRTFSYLKNKMSSSKKSKEKEKDKEKLKEKEKDSKDKDKKMTNGHLFSATPTVGPFNCHHCQKPFNKDSLACTYCGVLVHKSCKENLAACSKVKMKKTGLQPHDTSSLPTVVMRSKTSQPKERPRSAILAPDENTVTSLFNNRRSQQLPNPALSKSVSIQNIAGVGNDESMLHTWKFLSHSTDSLNKICRVNESMESLTDEGADMNEGQLMGDFETDSKQLEAQSWSQVVDSKFLRQQKKDVVKRQDVIYELMQTEMHHVRTLKIMSDVYSRGMVQELQYEQQMVEKVFPCLDDLLNIHSQFFQRILERKKESLADRSDKNFVIKRIGDILVNQFSWENAERMKKTYGKFCGHQNEAVNYFKDLYSKEKRFQAFIKKKMSSSVVRRLGIPECILLVTQRITKYPVLLQRILQYTKENDIEHQDLVLSLNLVKEVITAVNSKVSNYEKKMRLNEIYTRSDSKSIMRMKSGQMFAREDLRRRKFVRDGPVSLKNAAGRLKEVQAVLLSDVLIFLQEKDQKYVFASLDQKSTVISLKKLIVREVAHEEKGLFLISMGGKDPEMVEVHASSKEERNSWIQSIQDTINTMDKEEDEGVPSELEEEKRVLDSKARELKEQLQQKDQQIITLLEEKEKIFRDLTDCSGHEDSLGARALFRANTEEAPKGESIMKSVINEVELLQGLVSRSLGSAFGQQMSSLGLEQEGVGPVSLPRRAETFGGFDSHQMSACKGGEKDEGDEVQDLRRTESDSVLKKGGMANLMFVLKRNNEQVLQSITHLHSLLSTLQAVVVQQDTFIEDQKQLLMERALSRSSFRPNSLIEQEKQRSLEKQRQELANLQKQQAQHHEEKRRREREWEAREEVLVEREGQLAQQEEQVQKGLHSLEKEREELQQKKAAYQLDLEHLRAAQKQLEKEKEQLRRDMEQLSQLQTEPRLGLLSNQHAKIARTPSLPETMDPSFRHPSSSLPKQGQLDVELPASPKRNSLSRTHKEKSAFHLIGTTSSGQSIKPVEGHGQAPTRLFGLAKPKEKKEKKKKGKGHRSQPADAHSPEAAPEGEEIFC
ncbi:A-kinase anchor protein 13 isoform X3 [Varanus komodoensis]|uniref:A-kinase anchor protein 13 isoform X3 n=1 Tax=Varanus komodoensis TaxID=61221 RepID=UPI001CF7DDD0|nr:A-kinase anchor protein 13 isoform X3 [Varanus komodoensis]